MKEYLREYTKIGFNGRLLLLSTLFSYVGTGVYAIIFNLFLVSHGFHEDFIGGFQAVNVLATGLIAVPANALSNRIGRRQTIGAGVLLLAAASVAQAIITNPALLLFAGFAGGAGTALMVVPLTPLMYELSHPDKRSHLLSASFAVTSLSTTIGSILGGMLPETGLMTLLGVNQASVAAYRYSLFAGAAVGALTLVPLIFFRPQLPPHREVRIVGASQERYVTEQKARRNTLVIAGSMGLLAVGGGLTLPFFNVYFTGVLHASSGEVGFVFALASLVGAAASLACPVLQKRFGEVRMGALLRLSVVPLFVVIAFVPSMAWAVPAYIIRITMMNMSWPFDYALISSKVTPRLRARAMSIRNAFWYTGWAVSSLGAGFVIRDWGYPVMLLGTAFFTLCAIGLQYLYFNRQTERKPSVRPVVRPAAQRSPAA